MKAWILICAGALTLAAGCGSSTKVAPPQKTALEVREMQTRSFATTDQKMVMKSLLNVLQDEGFIVKNANTELGLLTAEKDVQEGGGSSTSTAGSSGASAGDGLVIGLVELALRLTVAKNAPASSSGSSDSDDDRWAKYRTIDCSANISEYGAETRVRVNFQVKVVDNRGAVMSVAQLDDPYFYQDFFAKVDKGIFIAKEKL